MLVDWSITFPYRQVSRLSGLGGQQVQSIGQPERTQPLLWNLRIPADR